MIYFLELETATCPAIENVCCKPGPPQQPITDVVSDTNPKCEDDPNYHCVPPQVTKTTLFAK